MSYARGHHRRRRDLHCLRLYRYAARHRWALRCHTGQTPYGSPTQRPLPVLREKMRQDQSTFVGRRWFFAPLQTDGGTGPFSLAA